MPRFSGVITEPGSTGTFDVQPSGCTISGSSAIFLFSGEAASAASYHNDYDCARGAAVSSTSRCAVHAWGDDGGLASKFRHTNAQCWCIIDGTTTIAEIDFDSWLSDGFKLDSTTNSGASLKIAYVLWTGLDNATIKEWTSSSGGTQTVTGVGHDSDVLINITEAQNETPPATSTQNLAGLGISDGSYEYSMATSHTDGVNSGARYQSNTEFISALNATALFQQGHLGRTTSDGFKVVWTTGVVSRYHWTLCLEGLHARVYHFTTPLSTGSFSETGVTMQGDAGIFCGIGYTELKTIQSVINEMNIGCALSSSNRTSWASSRAMSASASFRKSRSRLETDSAYLDITAAASPSIDEELDFELWGADGFTMDALSVNVTKARRVGMLVTADPGDVVRTSWTFPGSGKNVTRSGSESVWTSPGNITADDATSATTTGYIAVSDYSDYLVGYNHGFSIPAGATINGIEVIFERKAGGTNALAEVEIVQLRKADVFHGNTKGDRGTIDEYDSYEVWRSYGGPGDLWGGTWTPADINNTNFGYGISVRYVSGSVALTSVDYTQIRVYYTAASGSDGSEMMQVIS